LPQVVPQGRLTNLTLIPTIKEEVIAAQRTDVRMSHIRRMLKLGEVKCFGEVDFVFDPKTSVHPHDLFRHNATVQKILMSGRNRLKGQNTAKHCQFLQT
jgi:hypothetical protein